MRNASQPFFTVAPYVPERAAQPRATDEKAYQAVTVAAIVLLLASLWLF